MGPESGRDHGRQRTVQLLRPDATGCPSFRSPNEPREHELGRDGQHCHEDGARPQSRVVVTRLALDDEAAEAAATEDGTQGCCGNYLDRRDADARQGHRQCQRQLHASEHLIAAHAHAPCGFQQVTFDALHPGVGRGDHWRDGQQDHRQERGEIGDVAARAHDAERDGQREQERHHGIRGDGSPDVGQGHGQE